MATVDLPSPQQPAEGSSQDRSAWLRWTLLLAVLWAAPIFAIQEWTLLRHLQPEQLWLTRLIRLAFDLTGCLLATALLRRWLLIPVLAASALGSAVLLVYYEYSLAPLSWTVVAYQWREGLAVQSAFWHLLGWGQAAGLAAALAVQSAVAWHRDRHAVAWKLRGTLILATGVLWGDVVLYHALMMYPLDALRETWTRNPTQYWGSTYGYALAWAAEARYNRADRLLARALEASRVQSDRLAPVEAAVEMTPRLCIVQVESLDDTLLGLAPDGREVMPFLTEMARQGMRYRLQAVHTSGSCAADFTMLAGHLPPDMIVPYRVIDLPYVNALPELARRRGYRTIAIHGNTGDFFKRREGWSRMRFDGLYFQEELQAAGLPPGTWGIDDHEVFPFAAKLLAEAEEPTILFLISLTTHTPFTLLPPEFYALYRHPNAVDQLYFNNMHYLDTQLRKLAEAVPPDTIFVVYGDHESNVAYAGSPRRRDGEPEFVPLVVFRRDQPLADRQRTRDGLAVSGELSLLDAVTWLRRQIETAPAAEPER